MSKYAYEIRFEGSTTYYIVSFGKLESFIKARMGLKTTLTIQELRFKEVI